MESRNWIFLLVLFFMLSGCASKPTTSLPVTSTKTHAPLTKTMTPSLLPDIPSTLNPTSSRTPTLLPTETSTRTLTFTPRPKLSINAAKTLILELVQEHEICQLPCLWGFVPGESTLEAAREFTNQFGIGDFRADDIELGAHNYDDGGSVGISYLKNNVYIVIHWAYNAGEKALLDFLTMSARPMESLGISPTNHLPMLAPVFGNPTFNQELNDYLLPSILSTFGQPEQILITVKPDEPDHAHINYHPFSLALYYPDIGIFVEYVMMRETLGSNYIGCPDKSHLYITVWDPEENISLESLVEKAGSEIALNFLKPVDEATSLTADEFHEIFQDPENSTCLETPIEIWALK